MILDLTEQVTQAQIAFGLAVIALLLVWIAFVRLPEQGKRDRKK